jgi:hypothetical protein
MDLIRIGGEVVGIARLRLDLAASSDGHLGPQTSIMHIIEAVRA